MYSTIVPLYFACNSTPCNALSDADQVEKLPRNLVVPVEIAIVRLE